MVSDDVRERLVEIARRAYARTEHPIKKMSDGKRSIIVRGDVEPEEFCEAIIDALLESGEVVPEGWARRLRQDWGDAVGEGRVILPEAGHDSDEEKPSLIPDDEDSTDPDDRDRYREALEQISERSARQGSIMLDIARRALDDEPVAVPDRPEVSR